MDVYEKKEEWEIKKMDYSAWLNGIYIMHAIGAVMSSDSKYPSKPFNVDEVSEKSDGKQTEVDAINFGAWVAEFNRRKAYEGGE